MDSSRFVRAVGPARIRTTTKLFAAGLLFAGLAAGATVAAINARLSHVPQMAVRLPPPAHYWALDRNGADLTTRTHLTATEHGTPIFERGRHDFVGVFGGCEGFYCFGRAFQSSGPFDFGHELTVSAWVRVDPPRFPYDHHSILGNGQILLGRRGSHFEVMVYDAYGASQRLENATPIIDGQWMHVAVTRTANRLSIWVDGNETRMDYSTPPKAHGDTLYIGRNEAGYPWSGAIDDVIVWDRALRPAELDAIE